ncbi:hypothetical protein RA263_27835, partial [Pseudomonas syringae pv. tagetis]|uniref:hypothetical protein n=1 Tax=Pseudomonas syringae group genomosp. 7 TaxID=251699 RepID=UPI00376F8773
ARIQQQARQAQTGKSQELTSLHSVSLSRLRAVGNGPDRSRQLLDFRQRGASGQVTAVMVGGVSAGLAALHLLNATATAKARARARARAAFRGLAGRCRIAGTPQVR